MIQFEASYLEAFDAEFQKIAKRARKTGTPIPTYSVEYTVECRESHKTLHNPEGALRIANVTIEGILPVIEGYEIVAQLDHASIPGEVLVRFAPGQECDLSRFHHRQVCDHCKTDRRRNKTVVFREVATGNLVQIGRNCSADFLRTGDIENILKWFNLVSQIESGSLDEDDLRMFGPRIRVSLPVPGFLRLVLWVHGKHGWMSRAKLREREEAGLGGGEYTTGERVKEILDYNHHYFFVKDRYGYETQVNPIPQPEELAVLDEATSQYLEYVSTQFSEDAGNEFSRTIALIVKNGFVPAKYVNHFAGTLPGFLKYRDALAEKAAAPKAEARHYPAEVGTRFNSQKRVKKSEVQPAPVQAEVMFSRAYETDFGYFSICVFQTPEGYNLTWKGSAPVLERGTRVELLAFTVKAHEVYKERPTTVIQRVDYREVGATPEPVSA